MPTLNQLQESYDRLRSYGAVARELGMDRRGVARRLRNEINEKQKMTHPKRHIVIPDCQVKPGAPIEYLSFISSYIQEQKPDVIVQIGDFADFHSLSSYDKGKKCFEGRSYLADVEYANKALKLLSKGCRKTGARMVFTAGNHECYDDKTEVLTRDGWKLFCDVRIGELVYSLNSREQGEWNEITTIVKKEYKGEMFVHSSRTIDLSVTPNHRVIYKTNNKKITETLAKSAPLNCDVVVSANSGSGVGLTNEQIRFIAVACTDSHFNGNNLYFYQSGTKADVIRKIIEDAGVAFKERSRDRDITHICGKKLLSKPKTCHEFSMQIPEWCVKRNDRIPDFAFEMSESQFECFLDVLVFCDGSIPTGAKDSKVFYGKRQICDDLSAVCHTKGYRATITEYRKNQYRVNIAKTKKCRVVGFLSNREEYDGLVWCVSVANETLLVRRNGKAMFCGNCRCDRAVESQRELDGMVDWGHVGFESEGWECHDFMKPVIIDGIAYAHYFSSGVKGLPVSSARALVQKKHMSCVMGHVQRWEMHREVRADGTAIMGLFVGLCCEHDDDYLGPQGNQVWRGIWVLNEVENGDFQPMPVSLNYLRRKYG